jgi:hypothetical protein
MEKGKWGIGFIRIVSEKPQAKTVSLSEDLYYSLQ